MRLSKGLQWAFTHTHTPHCTHTHTCTHTCTHTQLLDQWAFTHPSHPSLHTHTQLLDQWAFTHTYRTPHYTHTQLLDQWAFTHTHTPSFTVHTASGSMNVKWTKRKLLELALPDSIPDLRDLPSSQLHTHNYITATHTHTHMQSYTPINLTRACRNALEMASPDSIIDVCTFWVFRCRFR